VTRRFAIYAAPGSGSADAAAALLRERAEQWLGRSAAGEAVTPGVPAGWTREAVDAITVSARRYGFHGTLKAPFHLAPGRTPGELDTALAQFAAAHERVLVPRLRVTRLGGFFALTPGAGTVGESELVEGTGAETEAAELHALAAAVVIAFDGFRASPTEVELARRDPAPLTPRQRELLAAWGYPYVLDEFRFHLTVTDRIPAARQPAVERTVTDWFAASLGATVPVDALALFTEAEPGAPFMLQAVYPLRPVPSPGATGTIGAAAATGSEGAR
jgi:Protein of unknown function (DUF1045)